MFVWLSKRSTCNDIFENIMNGVKFMIFLTEIKHNNLQSTMTFLSELFW